MMKSPLAVLRKMRFGGSSDFWENRYSAGGNSGAGSYGPVAEFKSEVLNDFVRTHQVASVIELGCGDGHQLSLAKYPSYLGLDVSRTVVRQCIEQFADDPSKSFFFYDPEAFLNRGAIRSDLALSLDVIFHLVEDEVFERYMDLLFNSAERFVGVFSTDEEIPLPTAHVRHRCFSDWVAKNRPDWQVLEKVPNPHKGDDSIADFTFYGR